MADLDFDVDVDNDVGAVGSAGGADTASPDVDLSRVPEKNRAYVDVKKYAEDADYKRAADHGWKPLEAFIESGGDEAVWTGYKRFNKNYDDEGFRLELRNQLKESQRSQQAIIDTFEQQKQEAITRALADREKQLAIAIEENDTANAVKLQREIIEGQQAIKRPQTNNIEPLPIVAIRRQHEALNPASASFNKETNLEFEQLCMARAGAYKELYGRPLSDLEIKIIGDEALDMIKDKLAKPAAATTKVQTPPAVAKPGGGTPRGAAPKMSAIQRQMYDKLLDSHGKTVADNYLKNSQAT